MTTFQESLKNQLEELHRQGLRRRMRVVEGPQGREVIVDGNRLLNFCSNNYLGLADDPRLIHAAQEAMHRQGLGSGASRLVCGNTVEHRRLEEVLAAFKGTESCLLFSTGYMANTGIIPGLFGRDDVIFSDRLNHASILDGIQLSRAECRRYPHKDVSALEEMLCEAPRRKRKVIITDSVFSMDGDIAPLPEIVRLARRNGAMVMVDEAHALGVLGANGRGAVEHFGLEGRIDIQMGTLSKAAGAFGAYACGSKALTGVLVNRARSVIYTTGLPPSVAAAARQGIEIIRDEPGHRERLWRNTGYLKARLSEHGFDTGWSCTPIIPVIVGEARLAVELSSHLQDDGILVSAIRPPTVLAGTARLRITVMAAHEQEDLDRLVRALVKAGERLCLFSKARAA